MAGDINTHIGARLRQKRVALGRTQGEVAKALGIAPQQVQKYEKGTNALSAQRLHQFAEYFQVAVGYFFEDYGDNRQGRLKRRPGVAEERAPFEYGPGAASDRETLEILKSFKKIDNPALRKRLADLAHILADE